MKRAIAFLMTLAICLSFCACGSQQIQYPENWDRIAQATATLEQYLNCTTAQQLKDVMQSGTSQADLNMLAGYKAQEQESWEIAGITGMSVGNIVFVESYQGRDVFVYSAVPEGAQTMEPMDGGVLLDPQLGMEVIATSTADTATVVALVLENGRYVIANMTDSAGQSLRARYVLCDKCNFGTVTVIGETPCSGCNGNRFVPEQGTEATEGSAPVCQTCNGTGLKPSEQSEEQSAQAENEFEINLAEDCPDCDTEWSLGLGKIEIGSMILCDVCGGMGVTDITEKECEDCTGRGYTIHN